VKVSLSASGPADPDAVWDRYIHPARWPEWSPQITSVDYPDRSLSAGGTGTVHGPCGVAVSFEILAVDSEKRCWIWRVRVLGISLRLDHDVRAVNIDEVVGTLTTLEISGPAPLVIGYAPIARLALSRLVR
jgi:Polyketide cyclase / dehydrase and lipid transport